MTERNATHEKRTGEKQAEVGVFLVKVESNFELTNSVKKSCVTSLETCNHRTSNTLGKNVGAGKTGYIKSTSLSFLAALSSPTRPGLLHDDDGR